MLRGRWPWLGAAAAGLIWLPNLIWQAVHGWPQFAMASAPHLENTSTAGYVAGPPAVLIYLGLLVWPLAIAGMIRLWRDPRTRFVGVAVVLVVIYVLAWIPGKVYYTDGLAAAVLAAGSAGAQSWAARARRPAIRRAVLIAAPLAGAAVLLPFVLPVVPVTDVHALPAATQQSSDVGDTVGFPQLARAVAAQDAALVRDGEPPTSIYARYYGEAAALDVLGSSYHLPPVLSGQNAYWMWGTGSASDRTVLVVDALGSLRRYFADCRPLTTYHAPYHVRNGWTGIGIGVCTQPEAGWPAIWSHLKFYG